MTENKNIQIIDTAENCSYSIFQATQDEFDKLFPDRGQDIEYAEDLFERLADEAENILSMIWRRPIEKRNANGIHGTLFFGMQYRKDFFANKREKDLAPKYMNEHQRRLFGK